ncbi:ADP-ribosylglycohydrolase family protein [Planctomicrobium piriforme]|uniref:ADP-ribosylglycohydrolase n=1 Tax=Planctomicrobium piriforme TaxID=1576369 RepID=A0A1I3M780_9PLAN|nr:ADP-ribosylglycohydrolase family protein [Planctomicrobium piriforme]SFI92833.1 ADP-ribosylglycohydrolase [Planctomicrobium piriforme]
MTENLKRLPDNPERSARARLALEGLSVGDAFGQQFFFPWIVERADENCLPAPRWNYTDDTEMAIGIIQVLEEAGEIDQARLAKRFAERYLAEPDRGYGAGAIDLLKRMAEGIHWTDASRELFSGSGSFGNGAAMRAAPIGAWYAGEPDTIIHQAALSAEVTHSHVEGKAGAIAVALAASWAHEWRQAARKPPATELLTSTAERLPKSEVRRGIEQAANIPLKTWPFEVASELGCGHQITAQDTVPFCLWLAAGQLKNYCTAMWTTARIGGDIDTNCAIVGGIVALATGPDGVPDQWRAHREALRW